MGRLDARRFSYYNRSSFRSDWSLEADVYEWESITVANTSKKPARQSRPRAAAKPSKARATVKKSGKSAKAAPSPRAKAAAPAVKKPAPKAAAKVSPATASVPAQTPKSTKSQAGLGQRDVQHYLDLLLAKRRELVGDMSSMEREALRTAGGSNLSTLPIHMADMGTDNYEQEFTLGLMEKDRQLLREINIALGKIQNGVYGICEGTGKPIGKPRLEAQPWARYSIEYARKLEKRMGR
jgi:RNA polymerase-binding protein DksA